MSKERSIVKAGRSVRIREDSRLMHMHQAMVDILNGRSAAAPFMEMLLASNMVGSLEDDLVFSDDDDSTDDDDDLPCQGAQGLRPHPQIKQLTDEDASKFAEESMEEEDRRNSKAQKNKRKKLRKRERKRLEKENAVKENPLEEEEEKGKAEPEEENEAEVSAISCDLEANDSANDVQSDEFETASEPVEGDECQQKVEEKKDCDYINKTEKNKKNAVLYKSQAASSELDPDQLVDQKPPEVQEEDKNKVKEANPEVAETLQMENQIQTQATTTFDPYKHSRRGVECAVYGNRLAACGKYEEAAKFFTESIKYDPTEYRLFGNRGLCYERIHQYEKALMDANVTLSMNPNWNKGLFRKGRALCGLKRYYEASLTFKELQKQESENVQVAQELKRAQTLHLMEMGFPWVRCRDALKNHQTLEEAVEALFTSDENSDSTEDTSEDEDTEEESSDEEWEQVQRTNRPRIQNVQQFDPLGSFASRCNPKPELFPVWVGTLSPSMTYIKLHNLFSRAGNVYSIKMLLERQCAFVNYTRREDSEKAIQFIDGLFVEGAPLTVRYPLKSNSEGSTYAQKECFFWRTMGCTRDDCTFKHIPEHKHIDKEKFTAGLGFGGKY